MPKFPKGFGRRKSNTLEELDRAPVQGESSFRVFDRSDLANKSVDGGVKFAKGVGRASTSPMSNKDNIFEDFKGSRGSGGSNANTVSTTDNSSRLSAASTAPSSTDLPNQVEVWRSPHDKPFNDIPPPPPPKTTAGFSLKAGSRTFSFGRVKGASTPSPTRGPGELPPMPSPPIIMRDDGVNRRRAVTSSSHASTATPPKIDERELGLSLGGDFAEMFSGFGKRRSQVIDLESNRTISQSPEHSPNLAGRPLIGNRSSQPSPLHIDRSREIESAPYSWNSHNSDDRLLSNRSPMQERAPPVPRHDSPPGRNENGPISRPQPAETGVRRSSALAVRRQSTLEYGDVVDEDAQLLRDSVRASRRIGNEPRARDSWLPKFDSPYNGESSGPAQWRSSPDPASRAPPKAKIDEDNMFDTNIAESAVLAERYHQAPKSPPMKQKPIGNKVMTPAQFERYRQDQDRLKSLGGKVDNDDAEEDSYDDDEDESEKQKQLAKQRRKQEAHMAVYRQQMMKVTGETAPPPRPMFQASHSTPNLVLDQDDGEEEDEEIPLAILAAHGFPNKNRPPVRLSVMNSNPNLRAASQLGAYPPPQSVNGENGGFRGSLPVFARNLPQDPYFGAGLVNPANRESLAFGVGGPVGTPRGLPPGGLVGVIATEERSRAMRRGSPNAQGEYGPPPQNGFNGYGMAPMNPQMQQQMMAGQMAPVGQITPGEHAALAMAAQMQQFMQMQTQWMQSVAGGQQPGMPMPGQFGPGAPQIPPMSRSQTMGSVTQPMGLQQQRPVSAHQRTMSAIDPNAAPWQRQQQNRNTMFAPSMQGGYANSIAPSERSNVGMPGRYRPVSHHPAGENGSRSNTMSGALGSWNPDSAQGATVKVVKKTADEDEDDEEGWAAMKQKREQKKSIWRSKKDPNGLKEMAGFMH